MRPRAIEAKTPSSQYLPEARGIEARDVRVNLSHGVLKVLQFLVQHPVCASPLGYLFFVEKA